VRRLILATIGILLFSAAASAHEPPNRRPALRHQHQDPVGGFFVGGLSSGRLHEEDDDPHTEEIETEGGGGINLTGGLRFEPGLMVRASYMTTTAERWEDCDKLAGTCTTNEADFVVWETRVGAFYAPALDHRPVSFRVGGGYENFAMKIKGSGNELESDGAFVEGAVVFNAGRVATFDTGVALFGLENEFGDAGGAEFFGNVAFHTGPVDVGLGIRSLGITTELDDPSFPDATFTDNYVEGRLTIGTAWGYGSR
jgi:hypothetical protein